MASNIVSGTVTAKDPQQQPWLLMVSSTVIGAGTTVLMSIWQAGTQIAAAVTQWAVPAEMALRLVNVQAMINSSAVTGGSVQVILNQATASAQFTTASQSTIGRPAFLQMLVSAGPATASIQCAGEVVAGQTLAVHVIGSTAAVLTVAATTLPFSIFKSSRVLVRGAAIIARSSFCSIAIL